MIERLAESLKAMEIRIDVETMKHAEHSTETRTPFSAIESGGLQNGGHQEVSSVPVSSGHSQPSCIGAEAPQTPTSHIPTEGEILRLIAANYLQTTPPRSKADRDDFVAYVKEMKVLITGVAVHGSLLIKVKCDSLQTLERLWEDYSLGHLGDVVQRCFVTEEILTELSLAELKLKTTISKEEYKACKMHFDKNPTQDDTTEIVKRKITDEVGIPVDRQWLTFEDGVYDGKTLKDEHTLKDCNIQGKETLYLNSMPRMKKDSSIFGKDFTSPAAGARLGLRINCEVASQPCPQGGSSEMAASSQEVEEGIQETDALSVRSRKRRTGGSWGLPKGDDVLNLAAKRYLQEPEGSNGFVRYLTNELKVVLVDVKTGSLIITVECSSSQILEKLWKDYLAGYVNEKAHTFLATKEVLNELGLTEVKFTTKIPREEYESGRKKLLDIESSLQQKYSQLKRLHNKFQNGFRYWVSTRKHTRYFLRKLETELSSSRRRTEPREVPGNPPPRAGWAPWIAGGIAGGIAAVVTFGVGAIPAAAAAAAASAAAAAGAAVAVAEAAAKAGQNLPDGAGGAGVAGHGDIVEYRKSICKEGILLDKLECQILESDQKLLGNCVVDFAVFCRDHIDSVLSSELVEGEFRFLLDVVRGAHSLGAAESVRLPILLAEEMNIHDTRVSTLMEQLLRSTANQELSSITQQILRELREGPNDEEIRTMIMNFIQAKFTEACKS